jgi:hypothetical protein
MNDNKLDINPDNYIGRTLAETELLIKHLQSATIGQVFTYQEMNTVCKEDVQIRNTILSTARRTLLRPPHRMVFGTLTGIGIKRLSDEEIPDVAEDAVKRSKGIARRGLKKLNCADMAKMTPEAKVRTITHKTILCLFGGAGSRKVKALAEQAARTSDNLKIGDVASLFGK